MSKCTSSNSIFSGFRDNFPFTINNEDLSEGVNIVDLTLVSVTGETRSLQISLTQQLPFNVDCSPQLISDGIEFNCTIIGDVTQSQSIAEVNVFVNDEPQAGNMVIDSLIVINDMYFIHTVSGSGLSISFTISNTNPAISQGESNRFVILLTGSGDTQVRFTYDTTITTQPTSE